MPLAKARLICFCTTRVDAKRCHLGAPASHLQRLWALQLGNILFREDAAPTLAALMSLAPCPHPFVDGV